MPLSIYIRKPLGASNKLVINIDWEEITDLRVPEECLAKSVGFEIKHQEKWPKSLQFNAILHP